MGEAMPSLQIRDLPEPLHRLLQHRAQAHKRSLSQQALADLEAVAGVDRRERRRAVLEQLNILDLFTLKSRMVNTRE